jgi:hypothetical protein
MWYKFPIKGHHHAEMNIHTHRFRKMQHSCNTNIPGKQLQNSCCNINSGKLYQTGGICFNNDKYYLAATVLCFSSCDAWKPFLCVCVYIYIYYDDKGKKGTTISASMAQEQTFLYSVSGIWSYSVSGHCKVWLKFSQA